MTDITITVVGNVAADPVVRETTGGKVADFRLACTPRVKDRDGGGYVDGPTAWFNVDCWSALAANVGESVRKGERVIVSGRLQVRGYVDRDGQERTSLDLHARHVGHELTFGTTRFTRVVRGTSLRDGPDDEGRGPGGGPDGGPSHGPAGPGGLGEHLDSLDRQDFDALTGELLDEEAART